VTYIAVTAISHPGLVRDYNEDSFVVGPWMVCASTTRTPETLVFPVDEPLVVAVADGLGGHPAGDVASSIVVQELARTGPGLTDEASVRDAVDTCNSAVYTAAGQQPARVGMGTTVAGIVVSEDGVHVFNVGDSRVYAVDGARWSVASTDDSPPLASGQSHTSVVTQTLGGYGDHTAVQAHVASRPLAQNARFLVCTDGLSDAVDDETIGRILDEHRAGAAIYHLWRAAMSAGGPDNITLALVELNDENEADRAQQGADDA